MLSIILQIHKQNKKKQNSETEAKHMLHLWNQFVTIYYYICYTVVLKYFFSLTKMYVLRNWLEAIRHVG